MKYLFITILLLSGIKAKSQVWTQASVGITNKDFSGELQVGYRYKVVAASVGYTSLQFARDQPVLFNARAGAVLGSWFLYGGYVRSVQSMDDKSRNKSTWQAGAQYHFGFYDRGSFYVTGVYTQPARVTVGIGMSYNFFQP